ncbi:MAG: 16S rRNA (cytosine(1402)-N(4))-methyltransferase RsmH [Chitinophagaceae bacterium]|nr:MAG: 16S rRNA (cytosine(1402)-N(4))-methyltransferase RsmH [Chitinophagaceae bacterium]
MTMNSYHRPVLLNKCIEGLAVKEDGIYVDVTFGGGGHSKAILDNLGENGKLIGFDQDEDALRNIPEDPRFIFIQQNFRHLKRFLRLNGIKKVDGILADLGVSSHQIDTPERGFSTRYDDTLDMRMSKDLPHSAADILNSYSFANLKNIFRLYGEINNASALTSGIVNTREGFPLTEGKAFRELTVKYAGKKPSQYLAKVYQALRIEVNDEMGSLRDLLEQSAEVLAENGRLVVMSYHSLEDRLVKNFIKSGNFEGTVSKDLYGNPYKIFKEITKKPITATEEETNENKRARSAKLRIAERTAQNLDKTAFVLKE